MCFQQFRYLTFCPTISESSSDHFVILRYGDVEMLMCSLAYTNTTRSFRSKFSSNRLMTHPCDQSDQSDHVTSSIVTFSQGSPGVQSTVLRF